MADVSVRPARPGDATGIAQVQLRAWRTAYTDVLPSHVLGAEVEPLLATHWHEAASSPPSGRHHVLVALRGDDVVGFAALAPCEDEDRDPTRDAELLDLLVDPDHGRQGHGSRLLAASVDTLRADGFVYALAWLLAVDDARRALLTSSGWLPDGATRSLQTAADGSLVHQLRLHTDISDSSDSSDSSE